MNDEEAVMVDADNEKLLPKLPPPAPFPQIEYFPAEQQNETT